MHWTIEYLLCAIEERNTSFRCVERTAKISVNAICKWKSRTTAPHIDVIDKALNAVGYRLAIVPIDFNGDPEHMNRDKLQIAVDEAKRFIARAQALPEPTTEERCGYTYEYDNFPREQGAIKRASMDLTRALADLRKVDRS